MSDEYLIIHILNNLPSEYELKVEQMEGRINQYDNLLTLDKVCSMLSLKFEKLNVSNEDDIDDEEIEKGLVTSQFKGRCNNCGKYGHKKQDCIRNGNNNNRNDTTENKGGFNGTCNYRNKFGHNQEYCRKKQRD